MLWSEDWELLVSRAVDEELYAFLLKCVLDAHCFFSGMACNVEVESVGEEGLKLDAEQTAFGKHAAVALDAVAEVALCLFSCDDDGFAKESANLCSTYVERVGKAGEGGEVDVAGRRGESVAEACSVDKERKVVFVADAADVFEFLLAVNCSHFGREGDVDHARLYGVLRSVLCKMFFHAVCYLLCGNLAIGVWQGEHLMACSLDGACFVHIDVPGVGSDDSLIRSEEVGYDGRVGLSASHEEVYVDVLALAGLSDESACVDAMKSSRKNRHIQEDHDILNWNEQKKTHSIGENKSSEI